MLLYLINFFTTYLTEDLVYENLKMEGVENARESI